MRIEVQDLYHSYSGEVRALQGINVEIAGGEQVAIVGQNGAGKTTLVKHFNGLLKPSRGRVLVGDWDTRQQSVARLARRVGYVFQNPDDQLFARTVVAEVAVGPRNLRYAEERVEELVAGALARSGLEAEAETNPYDLPPTQRRMVAIASVLAMDTPIVVFDEPTMGQDPAALARLGSIVASLARQGKTAITITHDLEFAAAHFRRLIALRQGKVLLDGPMREMIVRRETLATTGVEPPPLTRLGLRLGFTEAAVTAEDFLEMFRRRFGG